MATVSITVPDALVPRLVAAMDATFPQYAGLSDANAFKAVTADYWREILRAYETRKAEEAAQVAAAEASAKAITDAAGIA